MRWILPAALAAMLSAGPALAANIGVSVARFDNAFQTIVRNGMQDEAARRGDVTLQMEDAASDPSRQMDQVRNFISAGVDAIVVMAVDSDGTAVISKMASEAKIPLVYVLHPPADMDSLPDRASFVGSNDSGTLQTKEVCRLLGGKGDVLVLMGPLNNHSSIVRTKDIHDVISSDDCTGMKVIEEQSANWDRLEAADLMTNWLSAGLSFDAVIANNDEMAIGAIQAMKAAGHDLSKVIVAGIDATPDGLKAMKAGEMKVTVFQNGIRQGATAVDAAVKLARGEAVERNIWVPFELVTPETMAKYDSANR
jgi:ribose transport system substrate-binding protein